MFFPKKAFFILLLFLLLVIFTLSSCGLEVLVNNSLTLDLLIHKSAKQQKFGSGLYTEILANVDQSQFTGLLLVISHRLRIDRDSCNLFGDIFSLELNNRWVALTCSHYMIRYESTPLRIRFSSAVFANLTHRIKIVLTAVRLYCPIFHKEFRQCPNHPVFCIPRNLFCDSVDNCGMGADELDCSTTKNVNGSRNRTYRLPALQQNAAETTETLVFFPLTHSAHKMLTLSLLFICLFLLAILTIIIWKKQISSANRVEQKTSICPKIEVTSENGTNPDEPEPPKKRSVVQSFIRSFRSQKIETVPNDGEEAIALLSLGLRNALYSTLPVENFQNEDEENGRIPSRSYHYSSSSDSSDSLFIFNEDE